MAGKFKHFVNSSGEVDPNLSQMAADMKALEERIPKPSHPKKLDQQDVPVKKQKVSFDDFINQQNQSSSGQALFSLRYEDGKILGNKLGHLTFKNKADARKLRDIILKEYDTQLFLTKAKDHQHYQ